MGRLHLSAHGGPTGEGEIGLQSQIRRAAVSVVANVAEGHGRASEGDFERHLRIAIGSLAETRQLILFANELGQIPGDSSVATLDEADRLGRQLWALMRRVARNR